MLMRRSILEKFSAKSPNREVISVCIKKQNRKDFPCPKLLTTCKLHNNSGFIYKPMENNSCTFVLI